MAPGHGHVGTATGAPASLPWGPSALEAARRGPGVLALIVDAAWNAGAPDQGLDWLPTPGADHAGESWWGEPIPILVDRDAEPAVALRVVWTLRLFDGDERLPHAALYLLRRDGRLLPLTAASRAGPHATHPVGARSRAEAERHAAGLRRALVASSRRGGRSRRLSSASVATAVEAVKASFEKAPGPIRPSALGLLLVAARRGDAVAGGLARRILTAMADGGVRDQLDGGFFERTRDQHWRLPDFVRTTRLNAALLPVYATAARVLGEPALAEVARGIADYLVGTLRDPASELFVTSQAVDESYYTWSSAELTAALPFHLVQVACMRFNVQPAARVVGDPRKNVLYVAAAPRAIADFVARPEAEVVAQLDDARRALRRARDQRAGPRVDSAHYVDVNGLAVAALLSGARVLAEPGWQAPALATLARLQATCFAGDSPRISHRLTPEGQAADGYLGDHAALGRAYLEAYTTTGEARYLARAEAVARALLTTFRDPRSGALVDAAAPSLVNRVFWPEQPVEDTVGPSPLAVALGLLSDLSRATGRARYDTAAAQALRCARSAAADDPVAAAGYHLALAEWNERRPLT